MIKNTWIYAFLLFGILVISCNSQPEEQKKNSPNIIFILTDDQGWTHVSHRADPEVPDSESDYYETPHMDRLALSGMMFTNGYAPNPICSPTRHSVMLGQNAARHIYNKDVDWYKKADNRLTIPKALKAANKEYQTAHFGKWHIAIHPKEAGFDYEEGMTSNGDGNIFKNEFLGSRQYTQEANDWLVKEEVPNPTEMKLAGKPSAYWNEENPKDIFGMTNRAKEFMKNCISKDKPFYVQLSHYATHLALSSKAETYDYFKGKESGERHTNPEFAAMLKDLDSSVGSIMDFVVEQGIQNNTYIFLMGDNGGRLSLNQIAIIDSNKKLVSARYSKQNLRNIPLRDGKHSFYEGGLRVPFMAAGPGIEPNSVSRVSVTGLDLLPTFASLANNNFEIDQSLDGGNLLPLLVDKKVETVSRNRDALIFHQGAHRKPRSAIIKDDYKLIKYWIPEKKYPDAPKVELYNIGGDLSESRDISLEKPDIAAALEKELLEFLNEVDAETSVRDIDDPYDRAVKELEGE
ncbi:MAG: sulfatase-like hydrolase/transferase [Fulvivirga sp.]